MIRLTLAATPNEAPNQVSKFSINTRLQLFRSSKLTITMVTSADRILLVRIPKFTVEVRRDIEAVENVSMGPRIFKLFLNHSVGLA